MCCICALVGLTRTKIYEISPSFPTNKSQCYGQQAISYSDVSEANEYIKYKKSRSKLAS